MSSFPVPVSPISSTGDGSFAARATDERRSCIGGASPGMASIETGETVVPPEASVPPIPRPVSYTMSTSPARTTEFGDSARGPCAGTPSIQVPFRLPMSVPTCTPARSSHSITR